MADNNIILISSVQVDQYVKSFFKTFGSVGYDAAVAKQVEKAMFEYFNNYVPKNKAKEFKLRKFGISLSDSEQGKIFVILPVENPISQINPGKTPAPSNWSQLDPGSLLAFERSGLKIDFINPQN